MDKFLETGPKRAKSWLNEAKPVITIAQQNRPMFVTEICAVGPKLTPFSTGRENFNLPGIKAGCERLVDRGVLEVADGVTGWQASRTHYRIRPAMESMSKIDDELGSSVLSMVRQSPFGKAIISSDLQSYLVRRLVDERMLEERRRQGEPNPSINEIDLRDMEILAKTSTRALEILVDPQCILYEISERSGALHDLALRVRRLRDVMMLALRFDLESSHSSRLVAEGISLLSSDDLTLTVGTETYKFRAEFDSKRFLTALNEGAEGTGMAQVEGDIGTRNHEKRR